MQLAVDPVRDAAEHVAYRFDAGVGIEEIERTGPLRQSRSNWGLQPAGGFACGIGPIISLANVTMRGEPDGAVGLLRSEIGVALEATAEGALGDVQQLGYGFTVDRQGSSKLRKDGDGDPLAGRGNQVEVAFV